MRRGLSTAMALVSILAAVSGCGFSRKGVTGLAQVQGNYYQELQDTLKAGRGALDSGLTLQLSADRARQRNILQWERDLARAEVLLEQGSPDATGLQRLLEQKLAELDLAALGRLDALRGIDDSRKQSILQLYDKVIKAAGELQKNNAVVLGYLESRNAEFFLRSVDLGGIARVVGDIQQARDDVRHADKQAQDEHQKLTQDVQQAVERARNLLIRVYTK